MLLLVDSGLVDEHVVVVKTTKSLTIGRKWLQIVKKV
jgi:hypothetical protein